MATYRMQAPNGQTYQISGPEGASDAQIRQAILAQHPEASQGRPVLSPRPSAQPAPQQNWFQRAVSAVNNAGNTYARPVMSFIRGAQDMVPGIDHIQAGLNEAGTMIGANTSNMSYGDRVRAFQQARQQQMQQDVHGNSTASALAHYAGEGVGAVGTGMGEARVASAALSRAAPVANFLQRAMPTVARVVASPGGKIIAGGATTGAVYGAGNTSRTSDLATNVVEGAALGAVGAPIMAGLMKPVAAAAGYAANLLGRADAGDILRKFTSMTAEQLQAARTAWKARTGAEPTVAELLPPQDLQKVQTMLQQMPSGPQATARQAIEARAANVGPEMSDQTHALIKPQRQAIVDQMAQDLANSREAPGVQGQVRPEDTALAEQAARNPNMLANSQNENSLMRVEAANIMAPHDNTIVAKSVNDLLPVAHRLETNGSVTQYDPNPDISSIIRTKAGLLKLKPDDVTVSDVSKVLSSLRDTAYQQAGTTQADVANAAINHLEQSLPADVQEAITRTRSQYEMRKQMAEGYNEGLQTRPEENISNPDRTTVNAYSSIPGSQGRVLGQASALEQGMSGRPGANLRMASDLATNPTVQDAVNRNLNATQVPVTPAGTPATGVGDQLADAAQAQTTSMSNLSALNPEQPQGATDLNGLMVNLVRMKSFSPAMQAKGIMGVVSSLKPNLPEAQAQQIAESLFSQNPTQISRAISFLNNAGTVGQQALRSLQTNLTGANVAANVGTAPVASDQGADQQVQPAPDVQAAPISDPSQVQVDPNAQASVTPVDPNQSPYMDRLNHVYQTGDPKLLSLANIVEQKESGGRQFDDKGNVITSPKGAVGLMQVEPTSLKDIATRAGIPVDTAALHSDVAYNKLVGVHYLDQLLTKYGGDRQKAAAAYNAGPGAVDKAISTDPTNWLAHLSSETQNYAGDIS